MIISYKYDSTKDHVKNIFWHVLLFVIGTIVVVRDITGVNVVKEILIGIAALLLLIGDKNRLYCFFSFLTPIATGISYTYISLIGCVVLLFKCRKLRVGSLAFICMFLLVGIELLSALTGEFDFMDFLRFLGVFFIVFFRLSDCDENYDNAQILKYFLLGYAVLILSLWGQMLNRYSFLQIFSLGIRFGDTREALDATEGMRISINQNGLAFLCTIAMWVCYSLIRVRREKIYLILLPICIIQGFLTQSRSFVLVFALSAVIVLFSSITTAKTIRTMVVIVAVLIISFFVLQKYFPAYMNSLILRFQRDDISGNRVAIMSEYFEAWGEYPIRLLIGSGLQDYPAKYDFVNAAHNSVQEILVTWGSFGLAITIVLFYAVLAKARKMNSGATLIQYIPFCIYILLTQSGQGFSDRSGMLRLIVVYSVIMLPAKLHSKKE